VEQIASVAFDGVVIGDEPAKKVDRVLDVRQGELCWVAGTVYMDMPLKPNILDDVSRDVSDCTRCPALDMTFLGQVADVYMLFYIAVDLCAHIGAKVLF